MTEVLIGSLSVLGTLLGSLGGILVSSKLTNYRLQQLENKVSVHNQFAMRLPVLEEKITELFHRLARVEHTEYPD